MFTGVRMTAISGHTRHYIHPAAFIDAAAESAVPVNLQCDTDVVVKPKAEFYGD